MDTFKQWFCCREGSGCGIRQGHGYLGPARHLDYQLGMQALLGVIVVRWCYLVPGGSPLSVFCHNFVILGH